MSPASALRSSYKIRQFTKDQLSEHLEKQGIDLSASDLGNVMAFSFSKMRKTGVTGPAKLFLRFNLVYRSQDGKKAFFCHALDSSTFAVWELSYSEFQRKGLTALADYMKKNPPKGQVKVPFSRAVDAYLVKGAMLDRLYVKKELAKSTAMLHYVRRSTSTEGISFARDDALKIAKGEEERREGLAYVPTAPALAGAEEESEQFYESREKVQEIVGKETLIELEKQAQEMKLSLPRQIREAIGPLSNLMFAYKKGKEFYLVVKVTEDKFVKFGLSFSKFAKKGFEPLFADISSRLGIEQKKVRAIMVPFFQGYQKEFGKRVSLDSEKAYMHLFVYSEEESRRKLTTDFIVLAFSDEKKPAEIPAPPRTVAVHELPAPKIRRPTLRPRTIELEVGLRKREGIVPAPPRPVAVAKPELEKPVVKKVVAIPKPAEKPKEVKERVYPKPKEVKTKDLLGMLVKLGAITKEQIKAFEELETTHRRQWIGQSYWARTPEARISGTTTLITVEKDEVILSLRLMDVDYASDTVIPFDRYRQIRIPKQEFDQAYFELWGETFASKIKDPKVSTTLSQTFGAFSIACSQYAETGGTFETGKTYALTLDFERSVIDEEKGDTFIMNVSPLQQLLSKTPEKKAVAKPTTVKETELEQAEEIGTEISIGDLVPSAREEVSADVVETQETPKVERFLTREGVVERIEKTVLEKVERQVLLRRMRSVAKFVEQVRGMTEEERKDLIEAYVSTKGLKKFTIEIDGKTKRFSHLKVSDVELDAIDQAVYSLKLARAGKGEGKEAKAFVELIAAYQLWKDRVTAPKHIQDLLIILNYKLQEAGLMDFLTTKDVKLDGKEIVPLKSAEEILTRTKTAKGRKEVFVIIQATKNRMLLELGEEKKYGVQSGLDALLLGLERSAQYREGGSASAKLKALREKIQAKEDSMIIEDYLQAEDGIPGLMDITQQIVILAEFETVEWTEERTEVSERILPQSVSVYAGFETREADIEATAMQTIFEPQLYFAPKDLTQGKLLTLDEYLDENELITKEYLERHPEVGAEPNAETHYFGLSLVREVLPEEEEQRHGYLVADPKNPGKHLAYLDMQTGELFRYSKGKIDRSETLFNFNVRGYRISFPQDFDPNKLSQEFLSLFQEQVDNNSFVSPVGLHHRREPSIIFVPWGYVKKLKKEE